MKTIMSVIFVLVLMPLMALAQTTTELPGQSVINKILEFISSGTGAIVISAIVEFSLRFTKSEKPLSIAHLVAGMLKMLGNFLTAFGAFLDKILPQKMK